MLAVRLSVLGQGWDDERIKVWEKGGEMEFVFILLERSIDLLYFGDE